MRQALKNSIENSSVSQHQIAFNKAVRTRQWSMIREKAVSYAMPPLAVASLFTTSLALNVWEHLPPQGRIIGIIAFAGVFIASPLLGRKSGSVLVTKKDAIAAIDKDLGGGQPARKYNDTNKNDPNNPLWQASKVSLWEKWGAKISEQKFKTGFEAYYNKDNSTRSISHGLAACALISSLSINGVDSLRQGWEMAADWATPLPALEYTARITPPFNVDTLSPVLNSQIQEALVGGQAVTAHEQSVLRIIAQNRAANIYINGQADSLVEAVNLDTRERNGSFIYEIELSPDISSIQIDGDVLRLSVSSDQAPQVTILGAQSGRRDQPSLRLEYIISDDTGAQQAIGNFSLPSSEGGAISPILNVNRLPEITTLPYD